MPIPTLLLLQSHAIGGSVGGTMVSLSNDFPKKFQLLLNASENKFQHSKVLISHIYQELENIHFYLVAHTKKYFKYKDYTASCAGP